MTYSQASFDLAVLFLSGESQVTQKEREALAQDIQNVIEDFIQSRNREIDPPEDASYPDDARDIGYGEPR